MVRGTQVYHTRYFTRDVVVGGAYGPATPWSNIFTFKQPVKLVSLRTSVFIDEWVSATVFLNANQCSCEFVFADIANYDMSKINPFASITNAGGTPLLVDMNGICVDMCGIAFHQNFWLDDYDMYCVPNTQYRNDITFKSSIPCFAGGSQITIGLDYGFTFEKNY